MESDKGGQFYLFRSWGRIGTESGGFKIDRHGKSKRNALEQFKTLYADKTGNLWEDRENFEKFPNKFYPVDVDFADVSKLCSTFL